MTDTPAVPAPTAASTKRSSDDISTDVVSFNVVFDSEIASINKRRGAKKIELESEQVGSNDGGRPKRPTEESNLIGVALSGGGVRSAAFCLGALQAMHATDVFKSADYLSTVS